MRAAADLGELCLDGIPCHHKAARGVIADAEFFVEQLRPSKLVCWRADAMAVTFFVFELCESKTEADLGCNGHEGVAFE